jgi:hypothetical protein
MRRTLLVARISAALLGLAGLVATVSLAMPAAADSNAYGNSGWEPTPSAPFDVPAVFCTFPVHLGIAEDGVKGQVLATYPDGSVKQEEFNGPLILPLTNLDTGKTISVNASGSAIVDFGQDGSQVWHTAGPVLFGFRAGSNTNHQAGLFLLAGEFTVEITVTGRNVTEAHGSESDLCASLS